MWSQKNQKHVNSAKDEGCDREMLCMVGIIIDC